MQALGPLAPMGAPGREKEQGGHRIPLQRGPKLEGGRKELYFAEGRVGIFQCIDEEERIANMLSMQITKICEVLPR